MSDEPKRRIIVPVQKVNGETVRVDRVTNVAGMLDRALTIIDEQLTKIALMSRQNAGGVLDDKHTRALHGHIKALVELSKEEREREKSDKSAEEFKNLSQQELLDLAQKTFGQVKDKVTE